MTRSRTTMKFSIVICALTVFFICGCAEQKVEPIHPDNVGMNEYKDPGYGFKIRYPKDWKQLGTTGKAVFARSQEVMDKFQNPSTGIEGGMVSLEVIRYVGRSSDQIIQAGKDDLKQAWQNIQMQPDVPLTVSGKQATNVRYSIPVTSKKQILAIELYVPGDTAMYKLSMLNFGQDQSTINSELYNAMINSFEIPVVVVKKPDYWQASPNMETNDTKYFLMQYPDNLNAVPASKGDKDLVLEMRADRQDCSIHIDVFGAKALTVDKVWEQNKGRYKAKATGETMIDGNKAHWVDYAPPISGVSSRAYFVVKNDKVIRTTLNWYGAQKDIYFPAFEKCVKSIKLKG